MSNVTAFVAHPDDDLLGVGGTLARHVAAGDTVEVVIQCTEGLRDKVRRLAAAYRVAERIGYAVFVGHSQELGAERINFDYAKADIIYTHHPQDLNSDHRRVAEAALVAGRFAQTVRCFETVSSTEWALTPFEPDYYVGIDLLDKMNALGLYESEMRDAPHPRSYGVVEALAVLRGSAVGLPAAEAFHTVRDTWK